MTIVPGSHLVLGPSPPVMGHVAAEGHRVAHRAVDALRRIGAGNKGTEDRRLSALAALVQTRRGLNAFTAVKGFALVIPFPLA